MRKRRNRDRVQIYIVRESVYDDDKYNVFVGLKYRGYAWDGSNNPTWIGNATALHVRFDTLPRARFVAKFLRDTYKEMGYVVECNLRPRAG